MNKISTCLSFFLFVFQAIHSQTVERSLSAGFNSTVELVKPYGVDKWLLAGRGEPEPGAYFQDTLFVAVIGNDGQTYLRKNLTMPFEEVHYWHDVLALPDGGILVVFESTLCDVGGYILTVQRLDAQGTLVWEKSNGFVIGIPRPPEKWFVTPDENLLGASYDQIWKVAPNTGDILWKADLQGVSGGSVSPYRFEIIAGTEDIFAMGNPDFQIWKKAGSPTAPIYVLESFLEVAGFRTGLIAGPNDWFYCLQSFPEDHIERVNLSLQQEVLPITVLSHEISGMAVSDDGFYLSESPSNTINRLRKFDLQGQNPIDLPAPSKWFRPQKLFAQNGSVAIAGSEKTGIEFSGVFVRQGSGAWIRTFKESSPLPITDTPNAAVTEIEQLYSIDTTRIPAFPSGYIYNLFGGGFRVKISNLGDFPIEKVWVNVVFERNEFFDICFNVPAKQQLFSNLNLAPGESVWVDFGDITAIGQAVLPDEICFWTSSPNEQPDAVHEDDRACHPASYTVGIKNPDFSQFSLSPNPADDFATVSFSENLRGEKWQIFDAVGRLCTEGTCPKNSQTLRVETALLPNGFYFVSIQNRVAKLVVRH